MKMDVSDKVATPQKRPNVKKGFYHARLAEVKPKKSESKYGKKAVLLFDILDEKLKDNEGKYLQLATEVYSEYKQEDGSYRTAVTPNSKITKVFQALGCASGPTAGTRVENHAPIEKCSGPRQWQKGQRQYRPSVPRMIHSLTVPERHRASQGYCHAVGPVPVAPQLP